MKKLLFVLGMIGFVTACNPKVSIDGASAPGEKAQSADYRSEAVTGSIGGLPWAFVAGTAKPSYDDASKFEINLNNEPMTDPCRGFAFSKASILSRVPAAVGESILGQGDPVQTATFFFQNDQGGMNMFVTEGRIKITEITDTEVTGAIIGNYDSANFVNGTFKLTRCAR